MICIILSLIFWALAPICNAIMDTLDHHFSISKFSKLNPNFWEKSTSSNKAYIVPYTKYKVDAWHLFKSAMIVFICCSMAFLTIGIVILDINDLISFSPKLILFLIFSSIVIIYGTLWNLVFNPFNNKILLKKK